MRDPGIPRHGSVFHPPTYGWFVDMGNRVVLTDRHGNVYPLESVSILSGCWGFDEEGFEKLPRPRKLDPATSEIVVEGDRVVIDFIDRNSRRPIVRGGIRKIKGDDFFAYNHDSVGNFNRMRGRLAPRRRDGTPTGHTVELRICDDDDATIDIKSEKGILLTRWTMDEVRVVITKGGTTEHLVKGNTLLKDLLASFIEIAAGLAAFGIPVVNTTGTTIPSLTASLIPDPSLPGSTGQGPYLTESIKAE